MMVFNLILETQAGFLFFWPTGHSNIKCKRKVHYDTLAGSEIPLLMIKNNGQALFGITKKDGCISVGI
jgi:hypothetical protein